MSTVLTSIKYSDASSDSDRKSEGSTIPALGEPFQDDRRFFWQKAKEHNLDAIATQVSMSATYFKNDLLTSKKQPSVYDDPILAEKYKPRSDWYAHPRPRIPAGVITWKLANKALQGEPPPLQPTGTVDLAGREGRRQED